MVSKCNPIVSHLVNKLGHETCRPSMSGQRQGYLQLYPYQDEATNEEVDEDGGKGIGEELELAVLVTVLLTLAIKRGAGGG